MTQSLIFKRCETLGTMTLAGCVPVITHLLLKRGMGVPRYALMDHLSAKHIPICPYYTAAFV